MADTAGCHSEGVCRCDDGSAGHSLRLPHMGGIRSGVAARVMARIRARIRARITMCTVRIISRVMVGTRMRVIHPGAWWMVLVYRHSLFA